VNAVKIRPRNLVIGAVLGLVVGGAAIRLVAGGSDNSVAKLSKKTTTVQPGIPRAKTVTGKKLPTATFKTFDGEPATFAALAGKPVVVNVWSYTCGPCIAEMPDFDKVHRNLGNRIAIIGMNSVGDSEKSAKEFAATPTASSKVRSPSRVSLQPSLPMPMESSCGNRQRRSPPTR
jgi:thiol-disulfide isomerase/thioredoxin